MSDVVKFEVPGDAEATVAKLMRGDRIEIRVDRVDPRRGLEVLFARSQVVDGTQVLIVRRVSNGKWHAIPVREIDEVTVTVPVRRPNELCGKNRAEITAARCPDCRYLAQLHSA